ncbi:MAG: phosphatase PAP2 family protein [Candidatus Acidiferrales bacterium]
MNSFDASIIAFLNQFAHRSADFDYLVMLVGSNELIKGGAITMLIWWAWFRPGENKTRDHEYLFYGILASFAAVLVARALADFLPFRERPFANPAVHFQFPYSVTFLDHMIKWSSFPSDHAAMFFALATSIFFVSRGAGTLALLHALFVVSLPRVYMGMHYPTDIVAGAAIGVGIASTAKIVAVRAKVAGPAMHWLAKSPQTFYPVLFLLIFLITVIFNPVRKVALIFFKMMELVIHRLH